MAQVIVIGGGAAGMLAAYAAAKKGHQVTLLEKNEKLGKKIYITGKGRCNITNAADIETIMSQVVSNPRFLYSALYGFTNQDMIRLLNDAGLDGVLAAAADAVNAQHDALDGHTVGNGQDTGSFQRAVGQKKASFHIDHLQNKRFSLF